MDFRSSETVVGPQSADLLPSSAAMAVKVVIVGGFGVGKTTLVGSVSEIRPLTTEETMTQAGADVDDVAGVERKTSTTVAMDFGRISINEELVLYVFGTPARSGSGSSGTACSRARSARWCWSTPVGWRSAST